MLHPYFRLLRREQKLFSVPNNPTANVFEREAIERIIAGFDGIVVLDEAYIDFAVEHCFHRASWHTKCHYFADLFQSLGHGSSTARWRFCR